ncbi:MAG: diguanylate cyclase [Desulfuromonadaceae bacterium]|nr:diguanylate cyclase [Desulfuromonadaceae bacterium]MDD5106149.1 diguanylate cyclase [Desulfuromonadaceae bacterium]
MIATISKILIIDDEPVNVHLLEVMLASDYEIHIALNGPEALKLAEQYLPDLILLDIVMPEIDGFETFRRLRKIESLANVPIIFLTALEGKADESCGLELGAADYITKPYNAEVVRLRVRNHLLLKQQRDLLVNISLTDGLTGVPNRRRFDEFLELEWRRAVRSKTMMSLLLIDIDWFKQYNDIYGHIAGDEGLKEIARTLCEMMRRPSDLMARYGGEEFGCVLPETDAAGALHIAELLRGTVESLKIPHEYSHAAPFVTVSVGVACMVPTHGISTITLVQEADAALYTAKAGGRNRVSTFHTP